MALGKSWRKSTKSHGGGDCVEARRTDNGADVRDSKNPNGAALSFSAESWNRFIDDVKVGALDPQNHV